MRATHIHPGSFEVTEDLEFAAVEETGGERNVGVSVAAVEFTANGAARFIRIAAGGRMAMHGGAESGFVQIVRGRGTLGLPDGVRVSFAAPDVFLFAPNTLHSWIDIEEDTLMSACSVS